MIAKLNQRCLSWYFENMWLPDHRGKMDDFKIAAIKKTIADFIAFCRCDPQLCEIDSDTIVEFKRFSKQRKFSGTVTAIRGRRIVEILRHAGVELHVKEQ